MDVNGLRNIYQPGVFLIHLHIQKTAGTTLQSVLLRKFGPNLLIRGFNKVTGLGAAGKPLRQAMAMKRMKHGYFTGHICFGAHRFLPRPSTYFTFVRDPVSRVVSLYWHSLTKPDAYYHAHAKGRSLLEFVTDSGLMELDNGQIRFILGDEGDLFINRTPVGQITTQHMNKAIDNLNNYFVFVGTVENFDGSFRLLTRRLGWGATEHAALNVGNKLQDAENIPSKVRQEILARNYYDSQLYEYVSERINASASECS